MGELTAREVANIDQNMATLAGVITLLREQVRDERDERGATSAQVMMCVTRGAGVMTTLFGEMNDTPPYEIACAIIAQMLISETPGAVAE